MELEVHMGDHISQVCERAVQIADEQADEVHFKFNNVPVTVQPGEEATAVEARWDADREAARQAYLNSDEYKERQAREAEEYRQKCAAPMVEGAQTEAEMREAKVPWPYTKEQLIQYIDSLVERKHDYGTCVYTMSMAATAAFYYVSHKLGVTGFQASCADLDILRRTRSMKGPFVILSAEDALYPQYDLRGRLEKALKEWVPWLEEQAKVLLSAPDTADAHPDVRRHWKKLAEAQRK